MGEAAATVEVHPEAGFVIRRAGPDDINFVIGSWLENFKRESPFAHRVNHDVFFGQYRPIILAVLAGSNVLVAESEGILIASIVWGEDPEASRKYLHWVYVVKAQRRLGVGRALLQATRLPADLDGVRLTHPTFMWFSQHIKKEIRPGIFKREVVRPGLEEKFPKAVHDPCAAFYLALSPGANE